MILYDPAVKVKRASDVSGHIISCQKSSQSEDLLKKKKIICFFRKKYCMVAIRT